MLIISERHRCARVAASGGDKSAVLSCYYIKVRCLFKFTAPAAGAHYSTMYGGRQRGCCARQERRLGGTQIALDCYSPTLRKALFGMRGWGRAGVPLFLSRSPPSPLRRLLLVACRASPPALLSHVSPCLSALSAPPSHAGAPRVPPRPIPAHT